MRPKKPTQPASIMSPRARRLSGLLIIAAALLGLAGSVSIPFYFESSSILYKFGLNRWILRSAQVLGLVAGYLLICQILLGARMKALDRIFGLNNLLRYHRVNGLVIACLAMVHPILILISDDRFFIPFQLRYWPEFVGLLLLMLIIVMAITAHWRTHLKIAYHHWRAIHRFAAVFVVSGFLLHLFYASETFEQKWPEHIAWSAVFLCSIIFIRVWTRQFRRSRFTYIISSIEPEASDAIRLNINSTGKNFPAYAPGQFCFISFRSQHISSEEHPFTIASSPAQLSRVEFIIRISGDWTGELKYLQPGDKMLMDGPFGHFSHLSVPEASEIIMIAGGIGITPMLSMLRYMADQNDQRKITLVWSNQSADHVVAGGEFNELESKLKNFTLRHVWTRSRAPVIAGRRLDRSRLKEYLAGCDDTAAVFVCGPDQMIDDVANDLTALGFHKNRIHTERFIL